MPLQEMLRRAWNSKNYMSSSSEDGGKKRQPFLVEESSRATVGHITELMTSDYAWSCISLVSHIASEADRLGIWAECCPCPEHATVGHATPKQPHRKRRNCEPPGAASCHFKCCRAPELATGQAMAMQSGYLDKCLWEFSESLGETPPQRRVELQGAFSKALGRLWGFLFQSTGKYAFAFLPPCRGLNVT